MDVKVVQILETVFQHQCFLTVLDSRGLLWGTVTAGLPYEWKRINSPPGCVGEKNETDDAAYYIDTPPPA